MKFYYAEILFCGKCNLKCYYCLQKEVKHCSNSLLEHFLKWENFDNFIKKCHDNNIKTIYLSSIETEPMLYIYLEELVDYLINKGFNVGIRTNGTVLNEKSLLVLKKMKAEISISFQSMTGKVFKEITNSNCHLGFASVLNFIKTSGLNIRASIVINRFNKEEIPFMLESFGHFKENISYVQLRKIYKYYDYKGYEEDIKAFYQVVEEIKSRFKTCENFFESKGFKTDKDVKVYLWEDVFKRESLQSLNYFTNGKMSEDNLLIRIANGERI